MEASFVVPGPLDVAGTLSRLHLWDEDPVNHPGSMGSARSCRTDPLRGADLRRMQLTTMQAEHVVGLARPVASGAFDLDALVDLPNDEVIERVTAVRGFGRGSGERFLARASAGGGA